MTRFITVGTDSGTIALNPANICYLKKDKDDKCTVKFVDNCEPVTFDVSYGKVTNAIINNTGFTVQD